MEGEKILETVFESWTNAAFHLPRKSDVSAGNDVTPNPISSKFVRILLGGYTYLYDLTRANLYILWKIVRNLQDSKFVRMTTPKPTLHKKRLRSYKLANL